jgi:hypothetical protein
MEIIKKLPFNLVEIAQVFNIKQNQQCTHLDEWLSANYTFNEIEQSILKNTFERVVVAGNYWNEEELRIRVVGSLFYVADIEQSSDICLFYERALSATMNNHLLSVVCDCLVASSIFNAPVHPYFFLQELKKAKGEKKDPEAQMLVAMLIAQHLNNDDKPIYGGYLIGTNWWFSTLIGNQYCLSRQFSLSQKDDFQHVASILRKLKELILNR